MKWGGFELEHKFLSRTNISLINSQIVALRVDLTYNILNISAVYSPNKEAIMLIPLICSQCGSKLEVEDTKVSIAGDTVIVLPEQKFECSHCGTKYISGDRNKYAPGSGISVGSFTVGGAVTGNIVIGNGVVSATGTKKPVKKWWEFWK
jgi:hypothetical protein